MTDDAYAYLTSTLNGREMCEVGRLLGWSAGGSQCAEVWLTKQEFMIRTSRGWELTDKARTALAAQNFMIQTSRGWELTDAARELLAVQ